MPFGQAGVEPALIVSKEGCALLLGLGVGWG